MKNEEKIKSAAPKTAEEIASIEAYLYQYKNIVLRYDLLEDRKKQLTGTIIRTNLISSFADGKGRRSTSKSRGFAVKDEGISVQIGILQRDLLLAAQNISRLIDGVPDKDGRDILTMLYLELWTLEDAAYYIGVSENTARKIKRNALETITIPTVTDGWTPGPPSETGLQTWLCMECGTIYYGPIPPNYCPSCGLHSAAKSM